MAIQPRFRVKDYFHIYWSNFQILFDACVVEGCSASLTIAREKQTSNLFHLRWSSVENRVSRDVLTGKVYCFNRHKNLPAYRRNTESFHILQYFSWNIFETKFLSINFGIPSILMQDSTKLNITGT